MKQEQDDGRRSGLAESQAYQPRLTGGGYKNRAHQKTHTADHRHTSAGELLSTACS